MEYSLAQSFADILCRFGETRVVRICPRTDNEFGVYFYQGSPYLAIVLLTVDETLKIINYNFHNSNRWR
jgi:hypothetical protein